MRQSHGVVHIHQIVATMYKIHENQYRRRLIDLQIEDEHVHKCKTKNWTKRMYTSSRTYTPNRKYPEVIQMYEKNVHRHTNSFIIQIIPKNTDRNYNSSKESSLPTVNRRARSKSWRRKFGKQQWWHWFICIWERRMFQINIRSSKTDRNTTAVYW